MSTFVVAPECLDLGLRARALVLKGLRIEDASRELRADIDEEARQIRDQFDCVADVRSMPEFVSLREIIREVGAKPKDRPPSTQKLFEYAWKHGTLPAINNLVDAYNVINLSAHSSPPSVKTSASKAMTTAIQKAEPVSTLPDMPIEPSWIKEGNPVARGMILTQSGDKKVSSGMWSCEPGKFEWTFAWDEFVHVLEGEVDIVEDGTENVLTLRAGDLAHFPLGMKTHWHVKQSIHKFFVIRTPEPLDL